MEQEKDLATFYYQQWRHEVVAHEATKVQNQLSRGRLMLHYENELRELYQLREIVQQLIKKEKLERGKNSGKKREVAMVDENGALLVLFDSAAMAAEALGKKTASGISEVCTGKRETAYGHYWKYADELAYPQ